ncbi:MAG: ATP-binding protein [Taibaiella sp.]|jgi:signal transduction histidine kinase
MLNIKKETYNTLYAWGAFIICIHLTVMVNAQIWNQEIFKQKKTNTSPIQTDIEKLITHGKLLFNGNKADSAIKTMVSALEQSNAIQYRQGIDTSLNYVIKYLMKWKRGTFSTSQAEVAQKAIDYSNITDKDIRISGLHCSLGSYFSTKGNYAQALLTYERALKTLPDDSSKATMDTKMVIYCNISEIWATLGEAEEAFRNLAVAERIAIKSKDYHRRVSQLQIKGVLYFNIQNLDSALHFLNASLDMSEQHKNQHPPSCVCKRLIICNLGLVLLQKHRPLEALQLVDKQIAELDQEQIQKEKMGFVTDRISDVRAFLQYLKGYAYYELMEYKKCRNILLPLLSQVQSQGVNQVEANIHEVLAAQYDSIGAYNKAYQHKAAYTALVTDNKIQKEKSKLLSLRYSLEKMETVAQKQLLISRQRTEIKEKNFWIAGVSLGTLLLCTALFTLYRNGKNKQSLQNSLIINLKQEREITQLQAKCEGEEQERSRIAHELHDGIVSQLLALKLNVNALQVNHYISIAPHQLNDIALQLEEATQDLRRTAHNLMPDLLLQQGLSLSLAALIEKINRNTDIEADFQAYGILPKLSQDTELSLYRMVQELVQNVLKHAEATQLLMQLSCRDNLLSITVEDNGKGIPAANLITIAKSTGLANVTKRVELLGGHIDIKSKLGIQTTVYLEFDLLNLTA